MKKLGISVIALSAVMAGSSAFAAVNDTSLTTKKYVDDGLNYVYGKVKANKNEIGVKANGTTIQTSTGLYKEIEDLDSEVGGLSDDVTSLSGTVAGHTTAIGVKANGTTVLESTGLYKDIEDLGGDVSGLSDDVTTLSGTVSGLQATVEAMGDSDTTYNAGTGITIDNENNISVTGLATTTGDNADKRYVYQNGSLTELDVATSWSESVLGD